MQKLGSIDDSKLAALPKFVTLTYPGEWPAEPERWKRDLRTFQKRLERAYGRAAAVWRLEFQTRGAPHFHLLWFGSRWLPADWVASSWAEVVGSGDARHLAAGTRVEGVRTWRGVLSYASKYVAKRQEGDEVDAEVGRVWGIWNAALLPIALEHYLIPEALFHRIRRALLHIRKARGSRLKVWGRWSGCWLFLEDREGLRCLNL